MPLRRGSWANRSCNMVWWLELQPGTLQTTFIKQHLEVCQIRGGWQVPSRVPPCYDIAWNYTKPVIREQPLLPVLDVYSVGWVGKRLAQGVGAEMLPQMTHNPANARWTARCSLKTRSELLSSLSIRTRPANLAYDAIWFRSLWLVSFVLVNGDFEEGSFVRADKLESTLTFCFYNMIHYSPKRLHSWQIHRGVKHQLRSHFSSHTCHSISNCWSSWVALKISRRCVFQRVLFYVGHRYGLVPELFPCRCVFVPELFPLRCFCPRALSSALCSNVCSSLRWVYLKRVSSCFASSSDLFVLWSLLGHVNDPTNDTFSVSQTLKNEDVCKFHLR